MKELFDPTEGHFIKMIEVSELGENSADKTIDMSTFYAAFKFNLLLLNDERLTRFFSLVDETLKVPGNIGGYARYENDPYFRHSNSAFPNPWFITMLWMTQYHIAQAHSAKDLDIVLANLNWVASHASGAGILSEQLHPVTGEQLSAAPLTWSHAEYVVTIMEYLEKLRDLGICPDCLPPK